MSRIERSRSLPGQDLSETSGIGLSFVSKLRVYRSIIVRSEFILSEYFLNVHHFCTE